MKNKKNTNKSNWFSYVVLAVVLLIPFMYSFFYLKAYWDPYGHMDDIPVAIVNEDKTVDGQNKGKDLVDSLKKKNTLDISVIKIKQIVVLRIRIIMRLLQFLVILLVTC